MVLAGKITNFLLPAYQKFIPRSKAEKLVKMVSDVLPPLSDADNFNLFVKLPLLAAALHSEILEEPRAVDTIESDDDSDDTMNELLTGMAPALAEYVLCSDFDAQARSAAASCLHAVIASNDRGAKDCPASQIIKTVINPTIKSAYEKCLGGSSPCPTAVFKDCLTLYALMVSQTFSCVTFLV